MTLEPVKVFRELSNSIAATKTHFDTYSAGVSKLLKLKDEILYQAVSRKGLSQQQLANLTVTCSSLFLSKNAIQEQLVAVNAAAAQSVQQAEQLPTRALLHWMLIATKLLKQAHVSEHLHVRYRTARMLEIWDLAASAIPASPQPSPRASNAKQGKKSVKQATAAAAAAAVAGAAMPSAAAASQKLSLPARPVTPAKALPGDPGPKSSPVADGGKASTSEQGSGLPGDTKAAGGVPQPDFAFPTLPAFTAADTASASSAAEGAASARLEPAVPAAAWPQLGRSPSGRPRDMALLQINPAQLSRTSSRITGTGSPKGEGLSENATVAAAAAAAKGSVAAPSLVKTADAVTPLPAPSASSAAGSITNAGLSLPVAGFASQGSGTSSLLAAVNAVVGGLNLRHTASLTSNAALSPIAERSEVEPDTAASTSGRQHQQQEGVSAANGPYAAAATGLFMGMSAPSFRRTHSNMRTGASLTAAAATEVSGMLADAGAGQLSRQTSRGVQRITSDQQASLGSLAQGVKAVMHIDAL